MNLPLNSQLYDEKTFYQTFLKDLERCKSEVTIESPLHYQRSVRLWEYRFCCVLAILDRKILWEGSLNILSQTKNREIMRRIESKEFALEMFNFLKLSRFLS